MQPVRNAVAQTVTSRMSLAAVQPSRRAVPDKILLTGTAGIGKSTFGADAERPVFIAAEEGLTQLDVPAFPEPQTFGDVLDAVRTLTDERHAYRTLVLDTVDWIEPLIWADLCQRHKWDNLETPGYGKGYNVALDEWRKLIAALERLRTATQMEVILLAHTGIKTFSNPAGADYSRYEIKLHRGAAALLSEWCMAHLFATHEEYAAKEKGALGKAKGISTGRRVIKTERTAAWDAKNRYGLPAELPLSYADYAAARAAGQPASPAALKDEALALLGQLEPTGDTERHATIIAAVEVATGNATKLAKMVDRLHTLLTAEGA